MSMKSSEPAALLEGVFIQFWGLINQVELYLFYHLILICGNYKIHSQITLICKKSQVIYSQSRSIRRISLLKGSDWSNRKDFENYPRSPLPLQRIHVLKASESSLFFTPCSLPLIEIRDRSKETTYK